MNLVQITPGAGGMYCGNCVRDNALVKAFESLGHSALMVPLYLPLTLDEPDRSRDQPVFFGGVSVYLAQQSPALRSLPAWARRALARRGLLRWLGRFAARTRPAQVAALTVSMLRGEDGHQARELNELIAWLRAQPRPDAICLSNALLAGLIRGLRRGLRTPVACMFQGEEYFLDALPEPHRAEAWGTLAERIAEADVLVAPSAWYARRMAARLGLAPDRIRVVPNGIDLAGYHEPQPPSPPVVGYFARMCPDKGLDTLVEAFIQLRRRPGMAAVRLRVGGNCTAADRPWVERLQRRLAAANLADAAEFRPNLDRAAKLSFLRGLSVFSVPALYGEAFGLYLLEAWAAGVPVVQPRHGAFPELVDETRGVLCEPGSPAALADALQALLADPERCRALGAAGRQAVRSQFTAVRMAAGMLAAFARAAPSPAAASPTPAA